MNGDTQASILVQGGTLGTFILGFYNLDAALILVGAVIAGLIIRGLYMYVWCFGLMFFFSAALIVCKVTGWKVKAKSMTTADIKWVLPNDK